MDYPNNNTDMLIKNFKKGQKVKIRKNITITDKRHNSCDTMYEMAGSDKCYTITSVSAGMVHIKGYTWAPEDLISSDFIENTIPVNKEKMMFDPKELI